MVSKMAIENEVFGSCVGEINVSVEIENGGALLCYGWKYLRLIFVKKAAQDWRWRWVMVPGIGLLFWGQEAIYEIIKPLLQQGLFVGRVAVIPWLVCQLVST